MPMPAYPVRCSRQGCTELAVYKIAARWSDGSTEELKTYALACEACLPELFRSSRAKQAVCRKAPGEILEPPGLYHLAHGQRDSSLHRLHDREGQFAAP